MKPYVCLICNGTGKVNPEEGTTSSAKVTCHGCGGRGWIEVSEDAPSHVAPVFPYEPIRKRIGDIPRRHVQEKHYRFMS